MANGTFERHEVKYLLDSRQRSALERAMLGHMQADEYGESTICSLYYDTPDYRLIRRSLDKPDYKEKLRLRSYGRTKPEGKVFVELKKKYNGVVYKRRISMTEREAMASLAGKAPMPADCQIGREIDWFLKFYKTLAPAMVLCYDRIAYFCPEDDGLRITFDRNIRWRDSDLDLRKGSQGRRILDEGMVLMEVKIKNALSLEMAKLFSGLNIYSASFSKYGEAYRQKFLDEQRGKRQREEMRQFLHNEEMYNGMHHSLVSA